MDDLRTRDRCSKKPGYRGEDKQLDNETPEVKSGTDADTLGSQSNKPDNPAAIGYVINGKVTIAMAYLPSKIVDLS
jgi:hypothetical protein